MRIKILPLLLLVPLLLTPFGCSPKPKKKNVIIFVIDSLRKDYVGAYGFKGPISPAIDRIASNSFVFQNAFAPAPWTKPSVASLFTGRYPSSHGVIGQTNFAFFQKKSEPIEKFDTLGEEAKTLAETFKAHGYTTAAIMENGWLNQEFGFHQGFDLFLDFKKVNPRKGRAWEVIPEVMDKIVPQKPFFLYVHFMQVHQPYWGTEDLSKKFYKDFDLGEDYYLPEEMLQVVLKILGTRLFDPPHKITHHSNFWKSVYGAGIAQFDRAFFSMWNWLQEKNILDNTVVVITADHGESFFEHKKNFLHGDSLYSEEINIPLILYPPGGLQSRRDVNQFVSLVDLGPTLLGYAANSGFEDKVDGRDFSAILFGENIEWEKEAFSEGVLYSTSQVALTGEKFKFIFDPESEQQVLFNLEKDPGEHVNVLKENPEIAEAMRKRLLIHQESTRRQGTLRKDSEISDETIEELRALGYL